MTRPPHPLLRRLDALGAAPARAAARLGRALPALAALARDLGEIPLFSDRSLEPLLREIDLAGLIERAVGRPGGAAPPESGGGSVRPAALEPPRVGSRRRPAEPPAPRQPAGQVPHQPAQVAAALARYADAGGSTHAPRRPVASPPATGGTNASPSPGGVAGPGATPPANAAAPANAEGRAEARASAQANGRATADGDADPNSLGPSRVDALAALRERAARAGGPTAIDTPLGDGPAAPEVVVLLQGAPPEAVRPGSGDGLGADPANEADRSASPPGWTGAVRHLVRTLGRLESATAQRAVPAGSDAAAARRPVAGPGLPADDGEPPPPAPAVGGAARGGLRGLAALATGPGRAIGSRSTAAGLEGEETLPDVLLERMREAELAERLDRLLRREAGRQGIDLEGMNR